LVVRLLIGRKQPSWSTIATNAAKSCLFGAIGGVFFEGLGAALSVMRGLGPAAELGEEAGALRGFRSAKGGIFESTTNGAGGEVWTSDGGIDQGDVNQIVQKSRYISPDGEINIISGVHGEPSGQTASAPGFYGSDVSRFGNTPGVNVYDFNRMSPNEIRGLLNGPGTTIGAFCNSGICLAGFW